MKKTIIALVLFLFLGAAAPTPAGDWIQMVELSYVSQNCEMMGRLQVTWYEDWPPEGPRQEAPGYRIHADIGPDQQCGVVIYMPTRTDDRGRIGATIIGLSQTDTTTEQRITGR